MSYLADKPQTIMQLFKNGLQLWLHSYSHLFLLTVIAVIIGVAPHFFFPQLNTDRPYEFLLYFEKNFLYIIPYLIISLYFFSGIIFRIYIFLYNIKAGYREALLISFIRLPMTLLGIIMATLTISVGYFVLIIPGIYFTLVLTFLVPIILTEQPNPFLAFKECFLLVSNNWWRCFIVLFGGMLLFDIIIFIIEAITKEWWIIERPQGKIFVAYHLIRIVVNCIYYPLMCSLMLVTLRDLQLRRQMKIALEVKEPLVRSA